MLSIGLMQEGFADTCDYVIFIHDDLMCNAVNDLVDHRESDGYNVCLNTVYDDDTYAEIKGMISNYYDPDSNTVQPLYVLLIGDAAAHNFLSWDIVDAQVGNFIPTYCEDKPYGWWPEHQDTFDERYVCVDINDPPCFAGTEFPDMYFGRIPASDTVEVTTYLNKLFTYESNSGYQGWKDNVLLVAGDSLRESSPNSPPPDEVCDKSEEIAGIINAFGWDSNILYYSDAGLAARKDSLSDNINSGQLLVSALGTGADLRLFCYYVYRDTVEGVPPFDADIDLSNHPFYPIILGASCDLSRIDRFSYSGNENFYENLLFADSAGAISWIGATGATRQHDDFIYTDKFYNSLFELGVPEIGRLNYLAKYYSLKEDGAGLFTINQFSIYGDPAMYIASNPGFFSTFTGSGFELADRRVFQNNIFQYRNVINPNARILPEQHAVNTRDGQRLFEISGTDNSIDSSDIFWKLSQDTITINQNRRYLTYCLYVEEAPGGIGHFSLDGKLNGGNWLHEYNVFNQYNERIGPANISADTGSWIYYAFDLANLYGSTIDTLLIGFDDIGESETGDFKAYIDEIKFQSRWGSAPMILLSYCPFTIGLAESETLSVYVYDSDVRHGYGDTTYIQWSATLGDISDSSSNNPTYTAPSSITPESVDTVICQVSDNGQNIVSDTMLIYLGTNGSIVYDGHGGPINETDFPYVVLSDIVVPAGRTLTINEGSILEFENGAKIVVNGNLAIDGENYNDVYLNRIPNSGSGYYWGGIYFAPGANGTIEHCYIRNATIGIEMEDSSSVELDNCNISYIAAKGVDNDKGTLIARNTSFKNIGLYGLYAYRAVSYIDSCDFEACANYGIYVDDDPVGAGDSVIIQYCQIAMGDGSIPASSQYCVYSNDADKIRIENNLLRAYNQGGIGLYNSNARVKNNQIHNCTYYGTKAIKNSDALIDSCRLDTLDTGIYAVSGSDLKVRWCEFQNLNIGVKDIGSVPDLGRITHIMPADNGYNDLEDCTQYYIYHFLSPSQEYYWAEGNYFGSKGPDTSKFVGGPDYVPWLKEDPYPKKDGELEIPLAYKVNPNYPNPFNANTVISFSLAEAGRTKVSIYNILGQKIITLLDDYRPPGDHLVMWDGKNDKGEPVSTGIYLYRIECGSFVEAKKMTLIR